MNIVSPFGRVSRRVYLAVAVPLLVTIAALGWISWHFTSGLSGPISDIGGTPGFRWLLMAEPVSILLQWGLFCAAVKRLHDFNWSGVLALTLLWSWLRGAVVVVLPLIDVRTSGRWDLAAFFGAIAHAGIGFQFYNLALLIVLAIVPGRTRSDTHGHPATADAL